MNLTPSIIFERGGIRTPTLPHPLEVHHASPTLFDVDDQISPEELAKFQEDPAVFLANKVRRFAFNQLKTGVSVTEKVLSYLCDIKKIDELSFITSEVQEALFVTKICDQLGSKITKRGDHPVVNSSYALRTRLLLIGSPDLTPAEAYTRSIDYRLMRDRNYLSQPENWVPERCAIHARLVSNLLIDACALSKRLGYSKPTCLAIRGNTAVGKNTYVRINPLFENALVDGEPKGLIDPDFFNYHLRRESGFLITSLQVHSEATSLMKAFEEGYNRDALKASTILLKRLSTYKEFIDQVLDPAKLRKGEVILIDLAQSLFFSILRVLGRDPIREKDPCPSLRNIIDGSVASYEYRKKFINKIRKEPIVILHRINYKTEKRILKYVKHEAIDSSELLEIEKAFEPPLPNVINHIASRILTTEFIDFLIRKGSIAENLREKLLPWRNFPIGQSLSFHCLGQTPYDLATSVFKNKFGNFSPEPYSGDWLKEFPSIEHHRRVETKQTNELDDTGLGLHWINNKFSSGLNPDFSPEKNIQMRLGYFIVSNKDFSYITKNDISCNLLQVLFLHVNFSKKSDSSDKFIPFFVHPEAYKHFQYLHENHKWVSPEKSEFMGTPTSSYRSWIVRRVETVDKQHYGVGLPFIIKMGVSSSLYDTSRLIDRSDILRSLKYQEVLSDFHEPGLTFFPEMLGIFQNAPSTDISTNASRANFRKESGLIFREFPSEILYNESYILNISSLASTIGFMSPEYAYRPYIFNIIAITILKSLAKDTVDFFKIYFIKSFFRVTEKLSFEQGITLACHSQNLSLMINKDFSPRKFVYRDFEGIESKNTLEAYAVYYRYYVFIKLLNLFIRSDSEFLPPLPGVPLQRGQKSFTPERSIYYHLNKNGMPHETDMIKELSISFEQALELLAELDRTFFSYLEKYFDLEKAGINPNVCLPAAESGTYGEANLREMNHSLWQHRRPLVSEAAAAAAAAI